MSWKVSLIPAFEDNYLFVLHSNDRQAIAVDPGDSSGVMDFIEDHGLSLKEIWLTHHHEDHVGGVVALKAATGCLVRGCIDDRARLPNLDIAVGTNQVFEAHGLKVKILFLPGHTLHHIAYYLENQNWLFLGDVLFGMGCGRLFEGTYEQMYTSLNQIKGLHPQTQIFCAHEYTLKNGSYAEQFFPNDLDLARHLHAVQEKRKLNLPTVPLLLFEELKFNPFLRAKTLDEFINFRERRNQPLY